MKLPWDRQYLKISFHVIVTIIAIYILALIISNVGVALQTVRNILGSFVGILGPLVVALVFSYLVNPIVDFFEKKCSNLRPARMRLRTTNTEYKSRLIGTIATYLIIIVLLGIGIKAIVSKIGSADITELADSVNEYIKGFGDMLVLFEVKLANAGIFENINGVEGIIQQSIATVTNFVTNSILGLANSISKAGGWAVNLGIGLTVSFYLLVEKEKILYFCRDIIDVFFNKKWAEKIKGVCNDVNIVFSGYIGGQVTDAIIMAALISITFSILGIKYPVMIGLISGFSNLIPFVGAIVAFILSVVVGLLSGTPIKALYAAIAVLVLQQIDGMFIVPKVVGKSVELHPVLVLLSLSVFGSLFGILGMVVAVPCTALIKLFLSRLYNRKKAENAVQ